MAWSAGAVTTLEGGGWTLARADGLELEVHEGWVVVYVLVLEPCGDGSSQRQAPPPHSLPDHASALGMSLATSVHTLAPVEGTRHDFEPAAFCELGVGLIRGDTVTANVPEDVTLDGVSLLLEGRYRTGADQPWTPLSLRSSLPAEADLPLPATAPASAVRATLFLDPAALVDAIEPGSAPERTALDMLEALATTGTVTLSDLETP